MKQTNHISVYAKVNSFIWIFCRETQIITITVRGYLTWRTTIPEAIATVVMGRAVNRQMSPKNHILQVTMTFTRIT
jgi:hypothetical protein